MAKCRADVKTVDMFHPNLECRQGTIAEIRRVDVSRLSVEVVAELCVWCGVDRVGGCGACSDLKAVAQEAHSRG
jgi:hypothetical protein